MPVWKRLLKRAGPPPEETSPPPRPRPRVSRSAPDYDEIQERARAIYLREILGLPPKPKAKKKTKKKAASAPKETGPKKTAYDFLLEDDE